MNRTHMFLAIVLSAFSAAGAQAAGFEKSVMWSGRYAGIAGAAVGDVTGSQSLFFNPAGLAGTQGDASLNLSPTWLHISGNLVSASKVEDTNKDFIPFGAFSFAYRVADHLGIGAAAYVAGGERAVYDNVDMRVAAPGGVQQTIKLQTDLSIIEYALGAGYEVIPGLRLGAAWRIAQAKGSLSTLKKSIPSPAYTYVNITDAKETRYNAYRLGAQYESKDKDWGVGLTYRSQIKFNAAGSGTGATTVIPTNGVTAITVGAVSVGLIFPEAYEFGGHYAVNDSVHLYGGIDYIRYSVDDHIGISGNYGTSPLPNIRLDWEDMYNFRLGFEYTGCKQMVFRGGYAFTTRVTSTENAKATLAPAGKGHLFTLGAGTEIMPGVDLDGAMEYAFNHGRGAQSSPGPTETTREVLAGQQTDTNARSIGVHTGLTYRF